MRGRYMLTTVREHLEKHYHDPAFHGIDLRAAAARADSEIRQARSNSQIVMSIAQFVQDLGDSHTIFFPPVRMWRVEYGWELQMIGDSCYVVSVDPGSDAKAKGLTVGDRVVELDGYLPTRQHFALLEYFLDGLDPRPSVRFAIETSDGLRRTLDLKAKFTQRPMFGGFPTTTLWTDVITMADEVVIARLPDFNDHSAIDRVMGKAGDAATLILDLRGNSGGAETGLQRLAGHVFDRRLVIATIHKRDEARVLESRPARHPFAGRLYVLIDSKSASAAEAFARLIQLEGRGMVVGDRSAGLVMRSSTYSLSLGAGRQVFYGLSITDADVIEPDGARLEGHGVQPDALVLPTPSDLAAGRDPALALALRMAGHPIDPAQAGTLLPRRDPDGKRKRP
jgi:carboxyl-terminal processing protease